MAEVAGAADSVGKDSVGKQVGDTLVFRVPAAQTWGLFALAAVASAIAIYTQLEAAFRAFCVILAIGCVLAGLLTRRAYVIADADGIGVRALRREVDIEWNEVDEIQVQMARSGPTAVVFRYGAGPVSLPSFVLLPLRPMKTEAAMGWMHVVVRKMLARRPG